MKSALVLHGGGPTAVLNASLAGIIDAARGRIEHLWTRTGFDLLTLSATQVERAARAPGSLIGTTRDKPDLDFILRTKDIDCVLYTGGNGTMRAALALSERNPELRVIGVPKTIDNDISGTDHTPGYGSAARFAAFFARDAGEDNRSLPSPVMVLETLGRDTGWITAATALARNRDGDAPHLVYLPEKPLSEDRLLSDVERVYARLGRCVIAICEGQRNERGESFGADLLLSTSLAANLGHMIAKLITAKLGLRARAEKPGVLGRSCAAYVSSTDRRESRLCGRKGMEAALSGESGKMITLIRGPGDVYSVTTGLCDFRDIGTRGVPDAWIEDLGLSADFLEWLKPLVGNVPSLPRLDTL